LGKKQTLVTIVIHMATSMNIYVHIHWYTYIHWHTCIHTHFHELRAETERVFFRLVSLSGEGSLLRAFHLVFPGSVLEMGEICKQSIVKYWSKSISQITYII